VKVLVIGGTRFVGHELVWRLLAGGHNVTLLNRGQLPDSFGDRVARLRGDRTRDLRSLLAGREFDAAVDFAAYTGADGREAAAVLGGRVGHYVVISSGQVYLVRDSCPTPARESDYSGPLRPDPLEGPDKPEWDYGMGKRALEDALALAWDETRFPATRLRIPMVNGPRDHFHRIESYLWRMIDGRPILLPGGGERRVRHVYSGSVVTAILALLGRPDSFGQVYNLAQDETPTLRELLLALADCLGARPTLVEVAWQRVVDAGLDPVVLSPFSGRWMSFLDPTRARAELGFRHQPLASYLDAIVAAFVSQPPAGPPPDLERREVERALIG
jgi:nucleoside-diphosphate-sugar epimerase